jgi:taurine dioxygenase
MNATRIADPIAANPLSDVLGAEITGIDVSRPIDDATFAHIMAAFGASPVVVFRDQDLSPAEQVAFTRRFGEIQYHVSPEYCMTDQPEVMILTNEVVDGRNVGIAHAGSMWHSDHSYMQTPTRITMLHSRRVPATGGDTEWINMYAAYDALDDAMKRRIEGLTGIHTFNRLRNPRSPRPKEHANPEEYYKRSPPDAYHPIARVHEETGRTALYLSPRFTIGIDGMDDAEAQPLLDELFDHMIRPDFVYRHKWRHGDVVMWDNRATVHIACGGVSLPDIRRLHRTTVKGAAQGKSTTEAQSKSR